MNVPAICSAYLSALLLMVLVLNLLVSGCSYQRSHTESAMGRAARRQISTQNAPTATAPANRQDTKANTLSVKNHPAFTVRAKAAPITVSDSLPAKLPLIPPKTRYDHVKHEDELAPKRYDQPREAAEFFRLKRLPAGETQIPIDRYFIASEQMRKMPRYSTSRNRFLPSLEMMKAAPEQRELIGSWESLGPGNVGGRTRALLIHPTQPNIMYAAGVAGGVWKTTDGGALWSPIADLIANIAVNSMVMDPKDPEVIYAGTGEGFFNIDAIRGAGIFMTADGGANWTRLASTSTSDFYYINDLVISPMDSQRIYAATNTGVWRSVDSGTTWTRVLRPLSIDSTSSTVMGGCLDLVVRTDKATDYLFASCGTGEQAAIFRNTDGAGNGVWVQVFSDDGMGRTSLAIAPSNQNVIYAAASSIEPGNYQLGLRAIFRSLSSGDPGSWTSQVRNSDPIKLNTVLFSNPLAAFLVECGLDSNNIFANQGWYDNVIAVDPFNPERVWVGGIDLFRSDDGGMNWGLASYWWANGTFRPLAPQYAHADHHVIVFHPDYDGSSNQSMYIGTDGGIFRTDNAIAGTARGIIGPCNPSSSSITWTSLNNGYGVTQFYHGAVYPDGAAYFGGSQDNGTLRGHDSGGSNSWQEILGGDGVYVAVNPINTNIIYASNPGRLIQKSLDGGATFNVAVDGINDQYGLFVNPFVMDPSDPQRLWTGGGWIWRTTNGAGLWEKASDFTPGSGVVSAIAVAPTNANNVLAGMSAGEILRTDKGLTSDYSTEWAYRTPRSGFVSGITFDPTNENIAYATYSTFGGTHVWRSIDAGATWAGIEGTGAGRLPDVPVHSIVVDPTDSSRLYIGTDLGVFVSTDTGQTWAVENTGFANVITESLAINTVNGVTSLYAFTHGRGAWRVKTGTMGCNTTLSPVVQEFSSDGGTGSVDILVSPDNCSWTAISNDDWITINSGTNGNSSGAVSFTVGLNNTPTKRVGTLTIAGKTFTVMQEKCACSISPGRKIFEAGGGTGTVNVTAPNDSNWRAVSQVEWITIASGSSETGSGAVNYTVAANTTNSPRTTRLTIAGQPFVVDQDSNGCTVTPIISGTDVAGSLSAGGCRSLIRGKSFESGYLADRYSFTGTAGQTISITVPSRSFDEYLYLISPDGTVIAEADTPPIPGSGLLSLSVTGAYFIEITSNTTNQTGNYTLRLTLDNVPGCTYTLSPSNQFFDAAGGSGSVSVTTGNTCQWQVAEDLYWVSAGSGTRTGSGVVNYTVSSNGTENLRSGVLSIAGHKFPVTQDRCERPKIPISIGQTISGSLSTNDCKRNDNGDVFFDEYSFSGAAGQLIYEVVSASFPSHSTTLFGPDGSTISGPLPVTGTYTIRISTSLGFKGDYKMTLLSSMPGCLYSIGSTRQSVGASGGNLSVNVITSKGCGWQSVSHADWIALNSGNSGNGNATVIMTVAPYTSAGSRIGEVFVAGQKFTVTQIGDGSNCSVSPVTPGHPVSGTINSSDCRSPIYGPPFYSILYRADRYSFTAEAGQVLDLSLNAASIISSEIGLIGPDGALVPRVFRNSTVILPSSGTYIIEVAASSFPNNYTLSMGLTSPGCTPVISPGNAYFADSGGLGAINITPAPGSCMWTAISEVSWITINAGNTGRGNGVVSYSVATNTSSLRTGKIIIGGYSFTVRQGGMSCPQTIATGQTANGSLGSSNCTSFAFDATAGQPITFSITANGFSPRVSLYDPDFTLLIQDVSSRFPSGNDGFFSLPKTGKYILSVSRSGSLSEPGTYKLSLSSGTPGCTYSVTASNSSISASGGTGSVSVMTSNGCGWNAQSDVDWISFNTTGYNGNGSIDFNVASNPASAPRTGIILVAGRSFLVNQIGNGSSCTVSPIDFGLALNGDWSATDCPAPANGGSYTADRYSFNGAAGQAIRISMTAGLSNSAIRLLNPEGIVVASTIAFGTSKSLPSSGYFLLPATGTYLIEVAASGVGNYSLTLSTSASCSSSLSPNSRSFSAGSGTGTVNLTTGTSCNWITSSDVPWLMVTSSTSGSGNRTITYSVAVNSSANQRVGKLSIAGQTFTVTQSGRPCLTVTPINLGQIVYGELTGDDCVSLVLDSPAFRTDRYSFSGTAGQTVIISLYSAAFDPYLYLLGPTGVVLAEDDDGGSELNARIPAGSGLYVLPMSGTYTIEVTSFYATDLGNYALSLSNAPICAFAIAPIEPPRFEAAGGSGSVKISCAAACEWTASSQVSWITLTAGASGAGSGGVAFDVAPNTDAQGRSGTISIAGQKVTITQTAAVASVSAASFIGTELAADSIVAAFGTGLAMEIQVATSLPLPTTLAGTTVKIRDSIGVIREAPLFFVAPTQVNYLIPAGTAVGAATVTITSGDGNVTTGIIQIADIAPGLFSANASGQGLAAATVLRIKADGTQSFETVARFDESQNKFVAAPIDLGSETDQVFLLLFGTGFHKPSSLTATGCSIGGTFAEVLYAGSQGGFAGLDQANIRIPRSLIGRGEVEVILTIDGKSANPVIISIK